MIPNINFIVGFRITILNFYKKKATKKAFCYYFSDKHHMSTPGCNPSVKQPPGNRINVSFMIFRELEISRKGKHINVATTTNRIIGQNKANVIKLEWEK